LFTTSIKYRKCQTHTAILQHLQEEEKENIVRNYPVSFFECILLKVGIFQRTARNKQRRLSQHMENVNFIFHINSFMNSVFKNSESMNPVQYKHHFWRAAG
jgi:hypothetical protein